MYQGSQANRKSSWSTSSKLGLKETILAYLDPKLNTQYLLTGVSFALTGSGYDNLTAKIIVALPLWKQVEYFKHYRERLGDLIGEKNASNIVNESVFLCSIGTNDFVDINFFVPSRLRTWYTVGQYQDSLLEVGSQFIKVRLGSWFVPELSFPALGHYIPFFDFEKFLSQQALIVNYVTTLSNVSHLQGLVEEDRSSCRDIYLIALPTLVMEGLPDGLKSEDMLPTQSFSLLTTLMQKLLEPFNGCSGSFIVNGTIPLGGTMNGAGGIVLAQSTQMLPLHSSAQLL
eukprot:Gb_38395 [translate_table: standard]